METALEKIEKANIGAQIFDMVEWSFIQVMRGNRHFGKGRAKLAVELMGGDILTWIDEGMAQKRQDLWHKFINRDK